MGFKFIKWNIPGLRNVNFRKFNRGADVQDTQPGVGIEQLLKTRWSDGRHSVQRCVNIRPF